MYVSVCAQAAVAMAIMFVSYIVHTKTMPYLTRENIPQTFFDIINKQDGEVRDKKTMLMIDNAQSRLVRYVFDYNMLESVSIIVSTFILLVGMVRVYCNVAWCGVFCACIFRFLMGGFVSRFVFLFVL